MNVSYQDQNEKLNTTSKEVSRLEILLAEKEGQLEGQKGVLSTLQQQILNTQEGELNTTTKSLFKYA